MNGIDLIILLAVAVAAVVGLRVGGSTMLFGWVFFFGGLVLGWVVGSAAERFLATGVRSPGLRFLVGLLLLLVPAVVLGAVGRMLGDVVAAKLARFHLSWLNRGVGAGLSVAATLAFCWVIGVALSSSPFYKLNSALQRSTILRALDRTLPPLPLGKVRALLQAEGFPPVFVGLAPLPTGSVKLPTASEVAAVGSRLEPSVVKISGPACGEILEGSGFVVAPGYVMTNAHVVAGDNSPVVSSPVYGSYRAGVVYFNPALDIAVLRVPALPAPALQLYDVAVTPGSQALFLGYPGNGPYDAEPAGILGELQAVGPDIYYSGNYTRDVYEVEGQVRPGNSGGPLVDLSGRVIGVIFSKATNVAEVGYAVSSQELPSVIRDAERSTSTIVGTACTP